MFASALSADPAALEAALRVVEPAVRVAKERHLRRVVAALADAGRPAIYHPDAAVWVGTDALREIDAVPDATLLGAGDRVLLVTDPADRVAVPRPDAELLRDYWRMLFRRAVADAVAANSGGDGLAGLGPVATAEVRFVLEADRIVPAGADDGAVYAEFAGWFADRAAFARGTLADVFPGVTDVNRVRVEIGRHADVLKLFTATKPPGAADPDPLRAADTLFDPDAEILEPTGGPTSGALRRADRQAAMGNHVRAAILRTRAAARLDGADRDRALADAKSAIHDGLVRRLRAIFGWDYVAAKTWTRAVVGVLPAASVGVWPRAARALYDLQKIAVDLEREISTVDPVEWIGTLGRRPLRRPLTRARSVMLLRYLMSADAHLARAPLPPADRDRLAELLHAEIAKAEHTVRADLGPVVEGVLADAGFRPENLPERVARDKLVAELLDRACEHGYLRFADLRDAVSRNQLKMPDLRGPGEFFGGDPLLRVDARLAEELDGVYRRGEFYLRWIQRLNAAAFGTAVGRWLTRYVALPFGGALLTVEFVRYIAHEAGKVGAFFGRLASGEPAKTGAEVAARAAAVADPHNLEEVVVAKAEHAAHLTPESAAAIVLLGFFYLAMIHLPVFRARVFHGLAVGWRGVRFVAADVPLAVWRSPPVRAVWGHRAVRFVVGRFGLAAVVAGVTAGTFAALGGSTDLIDDWAAVAFIAVAGVVNTRLGRVVGDRAAEAASDTWRVVRVNLVAGLIGWVQWGFIELAGAVERALYSVDEWLRFREGQSGNSLVLKAVAALVWFPVAYLIRFGFMILLEPQINPVKHFPVVTVSHKLLLPLIPSAADATGLSIESVTLIIGCIPGVFGFMVWEVVANWRLYAATRTRGVEPAVLGHHGETMRGLLLPGFHSGTVPKAYRKIRAAVRATEVTGAVPAGGKWRHDLDHLGHAIAATVERELLPLLTASNAWAGLTPRVAHVRVFVQTIEVELGIDGIDGFDGPNLRLAFSNVDGAIVATLADHGWAARLTDAQRDVLGIGLDELVRLGAAGWSDASPPWPGKRPDEPWTWPARVAFWDAAAKPG